MDWLLPLLLAIFGPGLVPGLGPARARRRAGVTIPLDPLGADEHGPLPRVTAARGDNPPLVVIDPGHGGHDPGAASPFVGRREKDITLALGLAIRDALAATGRVRVAMTREDDTLSRPRRALPDRPAARRRSVRLGPRRRRAARTTPPAAPPSTPCPRSPRTGRRPCSPASRTPPTASPARRFRANPGVNMILIDLAQRESMNVSADFARLLYREAAPVFPFRPDWHRFAAFIVLKAPDMPSILFESGYLTNRTDAALHQLARGQARRSPRACAGRSRRISRGG